MKVRGKVTPKVRSRVVALKGEGLSLAAIRARLAIEGIELSRQGISDVLKAVEAMGGVQGAGGGAEGAGGKDGARRGRSAGGGTSEGGEERGGEDGEDDEDLDKPLEALSEGASVAAKDAYRDLVEVRGVARQLHPKVLSGDYPATQWATLKGIAIRMRKQLSELLPPTPPDPSKDPTNIGAREMVHGTVLRAIEGVEARQGRLCPRCRKEIVGG